MPDYPYPYAMNPTRPIGPGGARLRLFRRRPRPEEEPGFETAPAEADLARWRELLAGSVAELNESFQASQAPFRCALEEDEAGVSLRLFRLAEDGSVSAPEGLPEEIEEHLELAELPRWLARLRSRLGIVVDERA
ncbi:MAG: hypothetical protein HY900_20325 [Deltaproteobacteria bacterium]|nr:hypothetical protein [Deltaproteobacteria bacterium]